MNTEDQSYIEKNSMPLTECGCWIWMLTVSDRGYGWCKRRRKGIGAHRVSYEAFKGPVPRGLFVCHRCDIPCCVNPDHLFVGTHTENMRDMIAKGRRVHRREGTYRKWDDKILADVAASTEPLRVIAARYGVHFSTIHRLKKRAVVAA